MRTIRIDLGNGLQTVNLDDAAYSAVSALFVALGSRAGKVGNDNRRAPAPLVALGNFTHGAPDDDY
jgi:hypothetical protein